MTKYKNIPDEIYKSRLERTCALLLLEHGIEFKYEPYEFTLLKSLETEIVSYEKIGKKKPEFRLQSKRIRPIKYKPDFVGDRWIIETKGERTADFNIKWKLFKYYLIEHEMDFTLFMPTNKREILQSIELIKEL